MCPWEVEHTSFQTKLGRSGDTALWSFHSISSRQLIDFWVSMSFSLVVPEMGDPQIIQSCQQGNQMVKKGFTNFEQHPYTNIVYHRFPYILPVLGHQILNVVHPEAFSARLCATVYLRTDLATGHAFFARGRGCNEFPLYPLRTGACGSKRQSSELGAMPT